MSKRPLTEKQQSVYNFIVKQMASGFPPTVREICNNTGIKSTSTVHGILTLLEEEGYIVRDAKYSRAIKLDTGYDSSMVPLVGVSSRPIMLSKVDLPQPEGPMMLRNSPFFTSRFTFSNA